MFKHFSIAFSVASVVLAQSSSPASTSNPLIPSGISSGCQTFFDDLNKDTSLSTCITPLLSAAEPFLPGANSDPTSAQIAASLNTLCGSLDSGSCDQGTIQAKLAAFYSACSVELTSQPNTEVTNFYSVLYLLKPLGSALCTKNDNGDYCVLKSKLPGSSSATPSGLSNSIVNTGFAPEDLQKNLVAERTETVARRAPTAALVPNTTTYANSNLPFFFLQPTDSVDVLCTSCTRNILTTYIKYESDVPYAPGLASSPILKNQPELYKAITDKCGSSFLGGAVQAAGGLKGGILGNGAPRSLGAEGALTFLAVALGATAVTFSAL